MCDGELFIVYILGTYTTCVTSDGDRLGGVKSKAHSHVVSDGTDIFLRRYHTRPLLTAVAVNLG